EDEHLLPATSRHRVQELRHGFHHRPAAPARLFGRLVRDLLPAGSSLLRFGAGVLHHDPLGAGGHKARHSRLRPFLNDGVHLVSLGESLDEGDRHPWLTGRRPHHAPFDPHRDPPSAQFAGGDGTHVLIARIVQHDGGITRSQPQHPRRVVRLVLGEPRDEARARPLHRPGEKAGRLAHVAAPRSRAMMAAHSPSRSISIAESPASRKAPTTSSTRWAMTPEAMKRAPGRPSRWTPAASSITTSAMMLATTRSASPGGRLVQSPRVIRTRAPTPFCAALAWATRTATGSTSHASTRLAPSFTAAMARIPEPVPTS